MSILDIMIIAVVIGFTLISAMWGMVREVIAVLGLIAGLLLAGQLSPQFATSLGFISDPVVARGAAFVIIVIAVSVVASVVASILYFGIGLLFLGWLDALLGAGLGFIQGILASGVILVGIALISPVWAVEQLNQSSLVNKVFGTVSALALLFAPADLKEPIQAVANQIK